MPSNSRLGNFEVPDLSFNEYFIGHLLEKVKQYPNRKAYISAENPSDFVTFEQLYNNIKIIETYLFSIGFKKGDVVMIASQNCWQYIAIFGAVVSRGGALSGANSDFTAYEHNRQIKDCGAKLVFCSSDTLSKILEATKGLNVKVALIDDNPKVKLPAGVVRFSDIIKTKPKKLPVPKIDKEKDLVLIPYSSGTTGDPKGVMISHKNIVSMLEAIDRYYDRNLMGSLGIEMEKETICLIMPMFHVYGCCVCANAVIRGTTTVLMKKFDFELLCKTIQEHKVKVQFLVPMIVLLLVHHPAVSKYDLSTLRVIQSGAAPLGADICELAAKKYPHLQVLGQGYGMTEATVGTHFLANSKTNFAQTGLLAPNMQMKIIDPETGAEVPPGKEGEVCVRGPNVMVGYLHKPEATNNTIIEGWLHTGDIGYEDKDGLLYIVDRLKELIKVNGFQVPPAQLEGLLTSHPAIADAAVIGIPDQRAGELPKAYVVRKSDSLTEEDVKKFVADKTVHYKHLRGGVEFVKEIPRSPSGKILRKDLRALEKKRAQAKL
ncbi:unnamed protein product [Bursaphelenchus xylophilus]|nr:unnamed protein product [Bursaphelenchus xylophilus]CAG9092633.1 unnamed protein product [Bursaphelenchus xylophilus]